MSGDAGVFSWTEPLGSASPSVEDSTVAASHQSSIADAQGAAAAAAAKTAADASPRKRGRPRGDGVSGARTERALQNQIDAAIASQLDALHDPEAWGGLLALPGDAAYTIFEKERWHIQKDERRTLGVTGSAFARTLMITNPRTLAFLMLGAALFSVYGTRAIAEMKEYRDKKGDKKAPNAIAETTK